MVKLTQPSFIVAHNNCDLQIFKLCTVDLFELATAICIAGRTIPAKTCDGGCCMQLRGRIASLCLWQVLETGREERAAWCTEAVECAVALVHCLFETSGKQFRATCFPFLPFPLQYCSLVVLSHCLPVYGCTRLPSFCAICFWHWHDVIHLGNHQFKVPYFLPSVRDHRYENVLDWLFH